MIRNTLFLGFAIIILASCTALPAVQSPASILAESAAAPATASRPPGLVIEAYALKGAPETDTRRFEPVEGTQEAILQRHDEARQEFFPDNWFYEDGQSGRYVYLDGERLTAVELTIPVTPVATVTMYDILIQVKREDETLFEFPAGQASPQTPIQGLWVYGGHWALEVARVSITNSDVDNEVSFDTTGYVIVDGSILNELYGYEEAFGFQLMHGRPFYFFKRNGRIDAFYDGAEIPLAYEYILHYGCCSAASLNPYRYQNMVSFFAQREEIWHYVEIWVYE